MSEQEFELYLSLLSRFLKLSPRQRAEISDELRDHLEARLEELAAEGLPREQAVRTALEEFGDAAELADHFTQIARKRTRRLIMRLTVGTVAALAVGIFCVTAFWPAHGPVEMQPAAVAQQAPEAGKPAPTPEVPAAQSSSEGKLASERDRLRAEVEQILDTNTTTVNFVDTPLHEALEFLADQNEVAIMINYSSFEEVGIDKNRPINLQIGKPTPLRVVLELVLERFGLAYRVREGFVFVETEDVNRAHLEVRIYNCSDLLGSEADAAKPQAAKEKTFSGHASSSESLIDTLMVNTSGPWEARGGEGGTITQFQGLLVVNHTQQTHREVARLLDMMRASLAAGPGKQTGQAVTTSASGKQANGGGFFGGRAPIKNDDIEIGIDPDGALWVDGKNVATWQNLPGFSAFIKKHANGRTRARITALHSNASRDTVQAVIKAISEAGVEFVDHNHLLVKPARSPIFDPADEFEPRGKPESPSEIGKPQSIELPQPGPSPEKAADKTRPAAKP